MLNSPGTQELREVLLCWNVLISAINSVFDLERATEVLQAAAFASQMPGALGDPLPLLPCQIFLIFSQIIFFRYFVQKPNEKKSLAPQVNP